LLLKKSKLGAKMGFKATDKLSFETQRELGRELAISKEI
jgi:3-polyprenyl-4-hydroxybenzoate decarboxylase